MKKLFIVTFAAILCAFVLPMNTNAEYSIAKLDKVVTYFAERPVKVKCRTEQEDSAMVFAWGYVLSPPEDQNYTVINSDACLGALAIDNDLEGISDFYKIIGATVIIHEAFHLKKIEFNSDEAITECRAMENFDIALFALGAEPETIKRLMPLIIMEHWALVTLNPSYFVEGCVYPERYAQYGITNS